MEIRKALRRIFHCKYIILNKELLKEGIAFNWEPIFEAAGNLSNRRQRKLAKLIAEYVHGYTVHVYNEYVFMLAAVDAFIQVECMTHPLEMQVAFERKMSKPRIKNIILGVNQNESNN